MTTQTASRTAPRARTAAMSPFVPVLIRVPTVPHPTTRAALNRGRASARPGRPKPRRRLRREVRLAATALALGVPLCWGLLTLSEPALRLFRPLPAAIEASAPAPDPGPTAAWATLSVVPVDESAGPPPDAVRSATEPQAAASSAVGFALPTLGFEGSLDAGH